MPTVRGQAKVVVAALVLLGASGCGDSKEREEKPAGSKPKQSAQAPKAKPQSPEAEVAAVLKRNYRQLLLGAPQTESQRAETERYLRQVKSLSTSCSNTPAKRTFDCSVSARMPGYAPRAEQFKVVVAGQRGSYTLRSARPQ